jgi:hypothetical protein
MKPIGEMAAQHHWFRSAGFDVLGLAATGAAANNLAEIGIHAETLQSHLILGVAKDMPKRLYILDERGLVGTRQFYDFMRAVRQHGCQQTDTDVNPSDSHILNPATKTVDLGQILNSCRQVSM